MMTVLFTCPQCQSAVHVYPKVEHHEASCDICQHHFAVKFTAEHEASLAKDCPLCLRKDFYSQKDFNRKVGVILFIIAAILSVFTYGLSFVVLYLIDLFLFKRLLTIVVCYKCNTIFRHALNAREIEGFNHEMNDRIVYSDHDFQGKPLSH